MSWTCAKPGHTTESRRIWIYHNYVQSKTSERTQGVRGKCVIDNNYIYLARAAGCEWNACIQTSKHNRASIHTQTGTKPWRQIGQTSKQTLEPNQVRWRCLQTCNRLMASGPSYDNVSNPRDLRYMITLHHSMKGGGAAPAVSED